MPDRVTSFFQHGEQVFEVSSLMSMEFENIWGGTKI
jgi:hypothetical protein